MGYLGDFEQYKHQFRSWGRATRDAKRKSRNGRRSLRGIRYILEQASSYPSRSLCRMLEDILYSKRVVTLV